MSETAIDLAMRFSFICTKRARGGYLPFYDPAGNTAAPDFEAMLTAGITEVAILAEIERKDRDKSEWSGDLKNRLMKTAGAESRPWKDWKDGTPIVAENWWSWLCSLLGGERRIENGLCTAHKVWAARLAKFDVALLMAAADKVVRKLAEEATGSKKPFIEMRGVLAGIELEATQAERRRNNVQHEIEPDVPAPAKCRECFDVGSITVVHPRCIATHTDDYGEQRTRLTKWPYEWSVACMCRAGDRWMQRKSQLNAQLMDKAKDMLPKLFQTIMEYEGKHPGWRQARDWFFTQRRELARLEHIGGGENLVKISVDEIISKYKVKR